MTSKERKEIILSLIQDDLVNTKLVHGLCSLNLRAEVFYLNVSSVIFKLVGIDLDNPDNEPIYKEYLERCSAARYIQVKEDQSNFEAMANDIYLFLMSQKRTD